MKVQLAPLTVLVVALSAAVHGQPADFSAPVAVGEVTQIVVPQRVSVFGTVEPLRRSRVATETEGIVEHFPFVEGQTVTAGCVVAQLRTRILEIERNAATASLAEASAELTRLENGYRPEEIAAARSRRAVLEELATDAEQDLERTKELLPEGAATRQDYDKAKILLAAARNRLAEASAELALMLKGFRTEEIAKARAQLRQREAQLARIDEKIAEASIRAPFAGLVAETLSEIGQWVAIGDPVLELIQAAPVLVRVDLPERYLPGIAIGDAASLTFDALPDRRFEGTIASMTPQANPSARTFPLKIEVPNPDLALLVGMLARVELPVGEPESVIAVPKDAVVLSAMGNAVFIVNEGKARMVPVRLGRSFDSLVAVEADLEPGTKVVVRGNERLRDGQAVTIESAPSGPPDRRAQPGD